MKKMTKKEYKALKKRIEEPVMTDVANWIENIPVQFIYKEKDNEPDPLEWRTTLGWGFEYKGKYWGDYIVITDGPDQDFYEEILKECKSVLLEQASDVYIHKALLTDILSKDLLEEIEYRLKLRYKPVRVEEGNRYSIDGREWHSKFTIKYVLIKIRMWFIEKVLLKLLNKMLGI